MMKAVMIAALAALGWGCAAVSIPDPEPDAVETTILLIGDAGEPDPRERSAALDSLAAQAATHPERSLIVFLGDNVYPAGIPEPGTAWYADAVRRLDTQIAAVPPGVLGIFVPGNHDWAYHEPDGLYSIRRQGELVSARAGGRRVQMRPSNGCPGPDVLDIGRTRLLFMDTQWWLHGYIVHDSASACLTTMAAVTEELRVQTAVEDRIVMLLAHHPLMTGGEHGGYCGLAAPFHRFAGEAQDILSRSNRRMRDSIAAAIEEVRPLIFAAGHDHSLQVLRGAETEYVLVSGAGSYSKSDCAVRLRESYFVAQRRSGFMRVDILREKGVRLQVYMYDFAGEGGLAYTRWLEHP